MRSSRLVRDIQAAMSVAQRKTEKTQFNPSNLRILSPPLRRHWKRATTAVVILLLVSLLALPTPYVQKIIFDDVLPSKDRTLLVRLIAALLSLYVLRLVLSLARNYYFTVLSQDAVFSIKQTLFERVVRLPFSFFDRSQIGYLMARLQEVQSLGFFFSENIVRFLTSCLEFAFSLVVMLYMDWRLTLICCTILPVFYLFAQRYSRSLRVASLDLFEKSALVSRNLQETLSGMSVVKAFAAERRESDKIRSSLESLLGSSIVQSLITSFYNEVLILIGGTSALLVLWYSGNEIISGTFTVGKYLAFAGYTTRLFSPIHMVASIKAMVQPSLVALARVAELFGFLTEEEDTKRTEHVRGLQGHIEIQNLSFSYNGEQRVLHELNLQIAPNQKVAIVGPSGSGKTTILRLLLGFYRAPDGTIWIDRKDINTLILSDLRDRIGIVSQNIFLFNDTIYNNIRYSRPKATKDEVIRAAKMADAHDFIMAMPLGYDTPVGERAALISGGQRQRISIARAILKNPDLVIFDEAMSHLDAESERRIQRQIDEHFSDKTCIIVAHRLSTIISADLIYVLDQGTLAQRGSHEELLATRGRYWELYSAQSSSTPAKAS